MIIVAMNTEKTRMGAMGVNVDARNADAVVIDVRNIAHVASQYAWAPTSVAVAPGGSFALADVHLS